MKQQKYQYYHQAQLINMNILQSKKMLAADQSSMIGKAKFTYYPSGKVVENKIKAVEEHRK